MPDTPPAVQPTVVDAMITTAKLSDATTTVRDIRAIFDDDHVHAALILDDGTLIAVIERADLDSNPRDDDPAAPLGSLTGRVVVTTAPLDRARRSLLDANRRRLAVVDIDGTFRGLLCLNHTGTGFCSDQDVRARSAEPSRDPPG